MDTKARITGISVKVVRASPGDVVDNSMKLVQNGAVAGSDRQSGLGWPLAFTAVTYGSAADLWGLDFTPAEVNADGFGMALSAKGTGGGTVGRVDFIEVTVHYCR